MIVELSTAAPADGVAAAGVTHDEPVQAEDTNVYDIGVGEAMGWPGMDEPCC